MSEKIKKISLAARVKPDLKAELLAEAEAASITPSHYIESILIERNGAFVSNTELVEEMDAIRKENLELRVRIEEMELTEDLEGFDEFSPSEVDTVPVEDFVALTLEHEELLSEMKGVTAERDDFFNQLDKVTIERDDSIGQLEIVTAERDDLLDQMNEIIMERDEFAEKSNESLKVVDKLEKSTKELEGCAIIFSPNENAELCEYIKKLKVMYPNLSTNQILLGGLFSAISNEQSSFWITTISKYAKQLEAAKKEEEGEPEPDLEIPAEGASTNDDDLGLIEEEILPIEVLDPIEEEEVIEEKEIV